MDQTIRAFSLASLDVYLFRNLRSNFTPHFHEFYLAGCLLAGARKIHIGNISHTLAAGQTILLTPYVSHSCQSLAGSHCDWICAHIPCELAHKLSLFHTWPSYASQITNDLSLYRAWQNLAENLAQPAKACDPGNLLNCLAAVKAPDLNEAEKSLSMRRFCQFLERHLGEKLSLDNMALWEKTNKYTLIRKFSAATGLTPCKYRESLRIIQGQRLLGRGSGLVECAHTTGFYDQSHFSRAFKAQIGVTPGAYRACHTGAQE